MKQKYRIVEHSDGNAKCFYTIQVEKKYKIWFLNFSYWDTWSEFVPQIDTELYKTFDTLDQAKKFIRSQYTQQKIVETGEFES